MKQLCVTVLIKKNVYANQLTQCGTGPDWLWISLDLFINCILHVGICGVFLDLIHLLWHPSLYTTAFKYWGYMVILFRSLIR